MLEKSLESPLDCKEIQPVHPKGDQSWVFIGRANAEAETPILWPPDVKSWLIWKKPWLWERLRAREGDDRGLNGWMASPTWCTWVWVDSRSWWWTGRPGVLRFMGSQRVDMNEWLYWTALNAYVKTVIQQLFKNLSQVLCSVLLYLESGLVCHRFFIKCDTKSKMSYFTERWRTNSPYLYGWYSLHFCECILKITEFIFKINIIVYSIMLIYWHLHILGNDHHSRSSNHFFTYKLCSFAQACPALCNPMDWNMPGFPVLHYLLEFAQIHVYWVSDAIQSSCHLSSPSPPAFNVSQYHSLFQWVGSSHHMARVLELQLQH